MCASASAKSGASSIKDRAPGAGFSKVRNRQAIWTRAGSSRHELIVMRNGRETGKRPGESKNQSALEEFDPEKYGEKTDEKEECEPAMLAEYAGAMTFFLTAVLAATTTAAGKNLLPKRIGPLDLMLLGIATHKLSRIVSKSRITGALRAPFVHYICSAGAGEVEEEPRGRGLQRAIGELISCPYCMGPWSAAALGIGMLFAPRPTRFLASILTAVAVSDFLHRAYVKTKGDDAAAPTR